MNLKRNTVITEKPSQKNIFQALGKLVLIMSMVMTVSCSTADLNSFMDGGAAVSTAKVKQRPTQQKRVKIYYESSRYPRHYRVLGQVSANNDTLWGVPYSDLSIANMLKKQAATLGATGVIHVKTTLDKTTGDAIRRL